MFNNINDGTNLVKNPTPDATLKYSANQIWDLTSGELVEESMKKVGEAGGTIAGKYFGGLIGSGIGLYAPEFDWATT